MRRSLLTILAIIAMTALTVPLAGAQEGEPPPFGERDPLLTNRLAGPERITTAVDVSNEYATERREAVLVRADLFPDALAGTVLATAADGPLLLTNGDGLSDATAAELTRVMAADGTVFLAGGTDAISNQVQAEVEALGFATQRVAGYTRYATAVAIAEAANGDGDPTRIYIADGNTFPDALTAGHTAARDFVATTILTDGTTIPAETQAYLDAHPEAETIAVGQVAADALETDTQIVGADQYETSRLAVEFLPPTGPEEDNRVAIASGEKFPDALSGGTHAALTEQPMLLVDPAGLSDSTTEYLAANPPSTITVYGGTAAIPLDITREVASQRFDADTIQGSVYINNEAPVAAEVCQTRDNTIFLTWADSTITLEADAEAQVVAMELASPDRSARTTTITDVQSSADDVAAIGGTFGGPNTDGIREITVSYNVGLGLCDTDNGPIGPTNASVQINDEERIDARACQEADDDIRLRWFESSLTLDLDDELQVVSMELLAAGRDGTSLAIDRIDSGADDVDAFFASFDPETTEGVEKVVVTYNVGLDLCSS
ncbi:cell wall-binding repeat-containing protein [Euzebya tangerina]|uniref:cell wall-binding repeat-containing protein n=1 Tax=Euzebya tangerina TaxID=591198 RepID=UPI000E32262A|nr:cell wall-binding repeat-containing protein [Euzebya tangerina]